MSEATRLPTLIEVDPLVSRRGLNAQLGADLSGESVLVRTLEQVRRSQRLADPILVCRREHEARVREILGDRSANVYPHSLPEPPHQSAIRRSRKWGKEGWRQEW